MKRILLLSLAFLLLLSLVNAAPHAQYPAFGEPQSGFSVNSNGAVSANDDAVYKTSYYSTGGAWQAFTLTGTQFSGGTDWLTGSASASLSNLPDGNVYVVVYSCSRVSGAWDCHGGQWQLQIVSISGGEDDNDDPITKETSICTDCGEGGSCSCTSDEYCSSQGVCLLDVGSHNTYFVSVDGSNSNSGSFSSPWETWGYAFDRLNPGDILYMRGGEWKPRSHQRGVDIVESTVLGTKSNPIRIFNYPGEVPILNGEDITPVMYNTGLRISNSKNLHLKGFTVKNVMQMPSSSDQQPSIGIQCTECENIIYENLVIHDIEGRGIEHADWPYGGSQVEVDKTYFINVDVYNLFTPYEGSPGNAADAIIASVDENDEIYFIGCRTWNFSDDGLNGGGRGVFFHVKDSWSMSGDKYFGLSDAWEIEGHPFKFGGTYTTSTPGYSLGGEPFLILENSIGTNSVGRGIQNNNNLRSRDLPNNALIRNNLLYQVGLGNRGDQSYFEDTSGAYSATSDYTNNVELKGSSTNQYVDIEEASHSHNSWDTNGVTATESDYVSLDYRELFNTPRKPDGSLPDVSFGKLVRGSDLIDAGTVIPGYHCSSSGAHPGEDCVEWYGAAPDLGPFESNY